MLDEEEHDACGCAPGCAADAGGGAARGEVVFEDLEAPVGCLFVGVEAGREVAVVGDEASVSVAAEAEEGGFEAGEHLAVALAERFDAVGALGDEGVVVAGFIVGQEHLRVGGRGVGSGWRR